MFEVGGEAEGNTFTNAFGCAARDTMPDYEEQPASGRTPISRVVCGVGGPYGKGGNTAGGFTFDEAYDPNGDGGLIPWKDETYYMNDFETGTVQEISTSPFTPFIVLATKLSGSSSLFPLSHRVQWCKWTPIPPACQLLPDPKD